MLVLVLVLRLRLVAGGQAKWGFFFTYLAQLDLGHGVPPAHPP